MDFKDENTCLNSKMEREGENSGLLRGERNMRIIPFDFTFVVAHVILLTK